MGRKRGVGRSAVRIVLGSKGMRGREGRRKRQGTRHVALPLLPCSHSKSQPLGGGVLHSGVGIPTVWVGSVQFLEIRDRTGYKRWK